jgi:hypothetical protein
MMEILHACMYACMWVVACLPQAPVHAHLQRLIQVAGGGGDDALAAHTHGDVVKQRLHRGQAGRQAGRGRQGKQ